MRFKIKFNASLLLIAGLISIIGCNENSVLAPNEEITNAPAMVQGIPGDQINWISWKPEFSDRIKALNKVVSTTVLVNAKDGAIVGGVETLNNTIVIPSDALSEDTEITLLVHCMDDADPCVGEVEFLPDIQFSKAVLITLSYAELNYQGSPYDLKVYWTKSYSDVGWKEVEVKGVDTTNELISFEIDHFSRYAWAL